MMGVYEALPRNTKIRELERALDYIGSMVELRVDGDNYLGLYETLDAELESLKNVDKTREKIRQRLARNTMPLAA
ncbi:MAG: hypothetical protein GYB24_14475 [Rhodobacteraceae bacterium]|nr:hypothetical protein [Paracoccaceae bacterium]